MSAVVLRQALRARQGSDATHWRIVDAVLEHDRVVKALRREVARG